MIWNGIREPLLTKEYPVPIASDLEIGGLKLPEAFSLTKRISSIPISETREAILTCISSEGRRSLVSFHMMESFSLRQ